MNTLFDPSYPNIYLISNWNISTLVWTIVSKSFRVFVWTARRPQTSHSFSILTSSIFLIVTYSLYNKLIPWWVRKCFASIITFFISMFKSGRYSIGSELPFPTKILLPSNNILWAFSLNLWYFLIFPTSKYKIKK